MSGTSLDGVDAALCRLGDRVGDKTGDTWRLVEHHWLPYPPGLRDGLLALHEIGHDEIDRAARLSSQLADLYAESVAGLLAKARFEPATVRAIGCHGQTVRHRPDAGYSLQLNSPGRLAEQTGITVVADFRSRDIAAGGQGAPLVPAFHADVFRHAARHRVIVNIGGIANLTDLPARGAVHGFDCGPGNMLMDAWVREHWRRDYDANGEIAAGSVADPALLARLGTHPFFACKPPKSTGREDFSGTWLRSCLRGGERSEVVLSTLLDLTVLGIAQSIRSDCPGTEEVWLCGGGAHNGELRRRLAQALPGLGVGVTDALGIPVDWVEACAFAWLAKRCIDGEPGNLPEVTGARGLRVLGSITPK